MMLTRLDAAFFMFSKTLTTSLATLVNNMKALVCLIGDYLTINRGSGVYTNYGLS